MVAALASLILLVSIMAACGAATDTIIPASTVQPATATSNAPAVAKATPTVTSKPPVPTPAYIYHADATLGPDPQAETLEQQVSIADNIFIGETTQVGKVVWNTPDDKPADTGGAGFYENFQPFKVKVVKVFKGSLAVRTTVDLAMYDISYELPSGSSVYWLNGGEPMVGEQRIFFTGKSHNYRPNSPSTPLNYPVLWESYSGDGSKGGVWEGRTSRNEITTDQIENLVKK
jgi:hypothetical protein